MTVICQKQTVFVRALAKCPMIVSHVNAVEFVQATVSAPIR